MAKGKRGKGRSKGKRGKRGPKNKNQIPLDVLQRRLGKLSTIVAKRGGVLPKYY